MNKKLTFLIMVVIFVSAVYPARCDQSNFVPDYNRFSLSNGLEVYLVEDHRLPMIDFLMLVGTGSATDSSRLSGLCNLSMNMLMAGTDNYPGDALTNLVDSTGGTIEINTERDGTAIEGSFLSRDLDFALDILADMVQRPAFTRDDLERERRRNISAVMQRRSVAESRLHNALFRNIYENEGFGLPTLGSREGLGNIEMKDVKNLIDKNVRPNNSALFLGGNFDSDNVKKLVKKLFLGWAPGDGIYPPIVNVRVPDSLNIIVIEDPEAPGTDFMIGQPAVPAASEKTAALILFDYILGGGGQMSRLRQKVVNDASLASSISSQVEWSRHEGALVISGKTSNETAADAILETIGVIEELRDIRIPVKELNDAKNFFSGFMVNRYESNYSSLNTMATLRRIGLEPEFHRSIIEKFDNCDPNRLRDIAREFFNINNMTIVISGPRTVIGPGLSELGAIRIIESGDF